MYGEYAEQTLRASLLMTFVLIIAAALQQAALAHRVAAMVGAADPNARAAIVTSVTTLVTAARNPAAALPAAIATTAPACVNQGTDNFCKDTISVTATLKGGIGVVSTTNLTMANYNTATGTSGTKVMAHAVYSYLLKILNPKGTTIAQHRGIIGLTIIDSTTTPVIPDLAVDRNGNGMNGYDRASTVGQCAASGTCSVAAQPSAQPGVAISDTRIHAEAGTCSSPSAPKLCNPTGQTTPTPQPRDAFANTNVTDQTNASGWPK